MNRLTHLNGNGDIYFIVDGVRVRIDEIEELRVAEKLKHYEDLEEQGRILVLPCKEGDTIYRIKKFCEENIGYKEFYRPSVEFENDCEYYEPVYCAGDCEKCNAEIKDDKEPWYCSLNLDVLCEKCKDRFAIQKDIFTFSKVRQIYNTPMFNNHLSLEDIYYLSFEEAEEALKKIISV
jgi:hypothetical protein